MQRDLRRGHITIDFPTEPFVSARHTIARATRVFLAILPFLTVTTLVILIPAKFATQLAFSVLNVPNEGILSYFVLSLSDLLFGALLAPAVIFGLVAHMRTGRASPLGDALRWGRRLWAKSLWNEFKVEITVALWGLLLFIPGIVAWVRLALTDAIVGIEGDRTSEVLQRSRELTEGHRWRIFLALLPFLPVSLFHMYAGMRVLQYSRWLMPPVDSLFSVLDQWMTIAGVLIYLGLIAPPKSVAEKRKRRAA